MKKKISLITAGILLIAAVAFFAFNEIGMYIAVGGKYFRSFLLETAVYSFPPFVMAVSLFCLAFNAKKTGNVLFIIGLAFWAALTVKKGISSLDNGFIIGIIEKAALLLLLICLAVIKIKPVKGLAVAGAVFLTVFAVMSIVLIERRLTSGAIMIFAQNLEQSIGDAFLISAFIIILLNFGRACFVKSKPVDAGPSKEIEALKQLYEQGKISQQEYKDKRTELLKRI